MVSKTNFLEVDCLQSSFSDLKAFSATMILLALLRWLSLYRWLSAKSKEMAHSLFCTVFSSSLSSLYLVLPHSQSLHRKHHSIRLLSVSFLFCHIGMYLQGMYTGSCVSERVWARRVLLPLWTLYSEGQPKLWSIIYETHVCTSMKGVQRLTDCDRWEEPKHGTILKWNTQCYAK